MKPVKHPSHNLLLAVAALASVLLFPPHAMAADSASGRQPNIILVLTDDQGYGDLACHGHPFLKTPNLDKMVENGMLFENAFVTTSLCSPSRASFLSGQYLLETGNRELAREVYEKILVIKPGDRSAAAHLRRL